MKEALDALPTRQRDTLRRRFYQLRTLEEIAASEGVYRETVRQWQEKGLRALRRRRELQQFVEERTPVLSACRCGPVPADGGERRGADRDSAGAVDSAKSKNSENLSSDLSLAFE